MSVFTVVKMKRRRDLLAFGWVALALMLAAMPVLAQIPVGTILGVVKDSSGGVVPQVKVTAINVDTNEIRTATTGEDGAYRFQAMPTGHYSLKFEKEGFRTETQTGFTLDVASEVVVNPALQVGAAAQELTVTGEAPQVNTTTSALGGLVNEQKMAELPLNGRNYIDLTMLQPGIAPNTNQGTAGGVSGTFYSSNGAPILGNNINIDGAWMVTTQGGSSASVSGTTLGVDGIKEYKVITTAFSAEYGMTFGSQTTIVSKGGTNQWHGDVYDYLRNSALDAANYFDTPYSVETGGSTHRLPEFRRNNFGGSGGGPIRKDKTFFYAVYEGLKADKGFSGNDFVIPKACLVLVSNPCSGGGNGIPAGGVSLAVAPIVTTLAKEFSTKGSYLAEGTPGISTATVTPGQWSFASSSHNSVNFGQIRIDQVFSASDTLFGRWTIDDDDIHVPSVANAGANATSGTAFPDFYTAENSRNQFLTVGESHIFSPTLLNSVHASYTRTDLQLNNVVSPDVGGETGNPNTSFKTGFPEGTWTFGPGISAWGTGGTNGPPRTRPLQNIYTGSEDLFWVHNKHAFKVGVLYNRFNESLQASSNSSGTASFNTLSNFFSGQAQNLAGKTPDTNLDRDFIFNTWGLYIQDDFRATSRLTLNLGFRYEFFTTPYELLGRENSWIVNNVVNMNTPGALRITEQAPPVGPIINNRSTKNFSPRVGFAYDVFGNGKTAVHGAFGIYGEVGIFGGTVRHDLLADPPYSANFSLANFNFPNCGAGTCGVINGFDYGGLGGQAIPFSNRPCTNGSATATIFSVIPCTAPGAVQVPVNSIIAYESGYYGNTLDVADYQAQGAPHVAQWNLTIDQQLPGGFALSVSYVGTRGLQLFEENEGNYVYPCIPVGAALPAGGAFAFTHCDGSQPAVRTTNTDTGATNQLYWNPLALNNATENPANPQKIDTNPASPTFGQFLTPSARMNPYWNTDTYNTTHGDSWYHGLQFNVTRRLSHGLQMQAAYTFSKVLDTGQGNLSGVDCSSTGGDHGAMPLEQRLDRGPACFDITHNFHANVLYHFPNMKSTEWYSKLTNGWWMGNIVSITSGYGFSSALGGNTRSGNGTADRAFLNSAAGLAANGCLTGSALAAAEALGTAGNSMYPASCPYPAIPYNASTVVTGNPAEWYNPNMFHIGLPGFFGDSGRDTIRGPWLKTWNFSITKDTHVAFLGEAGNVEFRAEIFNVTNTPIFPTPSGSIFTTPSAPTSAQLGAYGVAPNKAYFAGTVPAGQLNGGTAGGVGAILTTAGDNRQIQLALKILW